MGRDDWYRRSTWTSQDQQEFWARLRRSRSDEGRAQYLGIQAAHLEKAGLVDTSMELLETLLREYPRSLFYAQVHCQLASCREKKGDMVGAVSALKIAIEFEKGHPTVLTRAFIELGRLIVEHQLTDAYDAFLSYRDERRERTGGRGVEALFPLDKYLFSGALAAIHAHRGDVKSAREHAKAALRAADDKTSPFRYHRDIGCVENTNTQFHRRVLELAADG